MGDTFRMLYHQRNGDMLIRWIAPDNVTHACEGADVLPGVRLIWTLCERDVPANGAHLGADPVTCAGCLSKEPDHG